MIDIVATSYLPSTHQGPASAIRYTFEVDPMAVFDWDEANIGHIAEHDVIPSEAEEVVSNRPIDLQHQTRSGEARLMQIGETLAGRVLIVVTTLRDHKTRVVTAFPASREYRAFYSSQKERTDNGDANLT